MSTCASAGSSTQRPKLGGYDFYRQVLGSPKYVVAPMVDASELAWRRLSRRYGAQLVYSPMINAKHFSRNKKFRETAFDMITGEEGDAKTDRPLIVQFCANDPDELFKAAQAISPFCDGVDLNLGCPQDIAKRGHYGAFIMDEWDLIYRMINNLHQNLSVPVTAKFRIYQDIEKTVEYAKMLERAGAQILTVHGRMREQRGHASGLASWDHIKAVKQAVSVPVFANGNMLFQEDIHACLEATGCDAIMTAEGNLYNVCILNGIASPPVIPPIPSHLPQLRNPQYLTNHRHPPSPLLALEYLQIVTKLRSPTNLGAIKGHLFKILRPALSQHTDLREKMGRASIPKRDSWQDGSLAPYIEICEALWGRMCESEGSEDKVEESTGLSYWLSQPYFRPLPPWERPVKVVEPENLDDLANVAAKECGNSLLDTSVSLHRTLGPVPVMG